MTFLTPARARQINPDAVRILVEQTYGYRAGELLKHNHAPHIAHPRHLVAFLLVSQGMSYPRVGRALGGKHHTAILHSVRVVTQAMAEDQSVKDLVDSLKHQIESEPARFTRPLPRIKSVIHVTQQPIAPLPDIASKTIAGMEELDDLILSGKGDIPRRGVISTGVNKLMKKASA